MEGGKSPFDTPSTKSLPSLLLNIVHSRGASDPTRPYCTPLESPSGSSDPSRLSQVAAQLPRCIHLPGICVYGGVSCRVAHKIRFLPNSARNLSNQLPRTRSLSPYQPTISAKMATFQNGAAPARVLDDSDVEEEALVADYQEQVQYEDGAELSQVNSLTMAQQTDDIQSRLAAAAQPLDFAAPLEVKFQSYDSYCSLFHFILNSEGPVDLEPPSVSNLPHSHLPTWPWNKDRDADLQT